VLSTHLRSILVLGASSTFVASLLDGTEQLPHPSSDVKAFAEGSPLW
jgi:hypothetical protein